MLTVELASERNPDIRGNGGYWSPGRRPAANQIEVASIAEAVRVCEAYISAHDLGGGNWTGGLVRRDGIPVARISYNGGVREISADAAARGRITGGDLFDDNARELDPATGDLMTFPPCDKCGGESFGTAVTVEGSIARCLPHLKPWKFAEEVRP